jgi:hypothetical protein
MGANEKRPPMTFNIRQIDKLDSMSAGAEEKFDIYRDELLQLFYASPEARHHREQFPDMGWADSFIDYGFRYMGYSIPTMTVDAVDELMEILPRKVSLRSRDEALDAISELVAFWSFLEREYNLQNAVPILQYLTDYSPENFVDSMFDPRKAGMAKSFFMSGQAAGFDMTDINQANQYMLLHNASQLLQIEQEQKTVQRSNIKEKKKHKAEKNVRKRHRKR